MEKRLLERQWRLLEWIKGAYQDKAITSEETMENNIAITSLFLQDLKEIGDYALAKTAAPIRE